MEPTERHDRGGRLAAPEQAPAVHVPGGQVRQRATAFVFVLDVFVLDAHHLPGCRRACGVNAAARPQLALPAALVELEDRASYFPRINGGG